MVPPTMRADTHVRSSERESTQADSTMLAATGLRAVSRIAEAWGLTGEQTAVLLGVSKSTYYRLLKVAVAAAEARQVGQDAEQVGQDAEHAAHAVRRVLQPAIEGPIRERLSLILGIYRGLHLYFSMNQGSADEWVSHPNTRPMFGGQSAKQMMLSGQVSDLFRVRQYVDALLV